MPTKRTNMPASFTVQFSIHNDFIPSNITLFKQSLQVTLVPKLQSLSIEKLSLKWNWGFQMHIWL